MNARRQSSGATSTQLGTRMSPATKTTSSAPRMRMSVRRAPTIAPAVRSAPTASAASAARACPTATMWTRRAQGSLMARNATWTSVRLARMTARLSASTSTEDTPAVMP
eukprot:3932370-Rhodomonas_salina.1